MPIIATAQSSKIPIDKYVDVCPHCHHALSPLFIAATLSGEHNIRGTILDVAYQCTRNYCNRLFIGVYKRTTSQGDNMINDFKLQKAVPLNYIPPNVAAEVKEISPFFEKIYAQASAAESTGLDEIAGVGYRKALEYLIKDYCIYKDNSNEEKIKKSFLGVVINDFVDDVNIKNCAQRAAWLGNDETHYVRKWEDKDINDLKILIELTSGWIRSAVLTKKYLEDMV